MQRDVKRRTAIKSPINFDTDKFKIWQQFFISFGTIGLDFLRSDFIKADLKCFGKIQELSDKFTKHVIIEAMKSSKWGRRWGGMGSKKHAHFGEDKINCFIISIDTSLYDENVGDDLSGRDNGFKSINGSFERRVLILSTK